MSSVTQMTLVPLRPVPDRRIRMDGPLNFRDLGGYLTQDGGMVRWRQVFRSDSLEHASTADVDLLVHGLGVRSVIDLRTEGECARAPRPHPGLRGVETFQLPLVDRDCFSDPMFFPGVGAEELYLLLLNRSAERIVDALRLLAAVPRPVVFHCGLGKDRTGLLAAVLLGLLGASDGDVVRDYVLSNQALPGLVARLGVAHPSAASPPIPRQAYAAEAGVMRTVLGALRHRHGAVVGYVTDHGLGYEVVRTLRSELVE